MEKSIYIGLIALALCACSHSEKTQREQTPLRVRTMVVAPQASAAVSRYIGTVVPLRETPLSMQSTGRVVAVEAKNGQFMRPGQTILKLDDTQALHALHGAEATFRHAEDAHRRVRNVHEKGVVSDQQLVEIESKLEQARAAYELAQQRVRECTLAAPCEGVLNGLETETGQTVLPGVQLCTLMDLSAFCVRFTVPENEAVGLMPSYDKMQGEVECTAINETFPITVTEKSMVANPLTHTYEVTARIEGGEDQLMCGMVGKVKLTDSVASLYEEIVIPASCVLMKPEGATVWVQHNGKATRRAVVVGGYAADGVRVTNGLQPGDSLIVEGYQKLYNGCPIVAINE